MATLAWHHLPIPYIATPPTLTLDAMMLPGRCQHLAPILKTQQLVLGAAQDVWIYVWIYMYEYMYEYICHTYMIYYDFITFDYPPHCASTCTQVCLFLPWFVFPSPRWPSVPRVNLLVCIHTRKMALCTDKMRSEVYEQTLASFGFLFRSISTGFCTPNTFNNFCNPTITGSAQVISYWFPHYCRCFWPLDCAAWTATASTHTYTHSHNSVLIYHCFRPNLPIQFTCFQNATVTGRWRANAGEQLPMDGSIPNQVCRPCMVPWCKFE